MKYAYIKECENREIELIVKNFGLQTVFYDGILSVQTDSSYNQQQQGWQWSCSCMSKSNYHTNAFLVRTTCTASVNQKSTVLLNRQK